MVEPLFAAVAPWIGMVLNLVILFISLFLILLVLIQRGKGGGLAGAFGAAGGSSAFGTRAGDRFTRVTLYVAGVWILLTMITVRVIQAEPKTTTNPLPPAELAE